MKKMLLAAAFLIGSIASSQAQSAGQAKPTADQLQFVSLTNALEASVVRSNPDKANETANTLMNLMTEHIASVKQSMKSSPVNANELDAKEKAESKVAGQFKMLMPELATKGKMLVEKARMFAQLY